MKKFILAVVSLLNVFIGSTATERPKLVIGIVVDQMRWDYLKRYENEFGADGFRRLTDCGFSYDNTMLNYVPAVTACGHTSIYTGAYPSISGIAGNDFYKNGHIIYCTDDKTVKGLGSADGDMSPKNMEVTTIGDELKLATDFKSKVIGISLKDRAAILPAGHSADAAYWFDCSAGQFISSTYYMKTLPQWVIDFNRKNRISQKPDVRYLPKGNQLITDMAISAIDNEKLGEDEITDMIAVSYSTTDYVGHKYGTRSNMTDNIYKSMDQELARLLHHLDEKVGKGQYLVFLTADHGASHNAIFLNQHRQPAGTWHYDKLRMPYIKCCTDYQIYLDKDKIVQDGKDYELTKQQTINALLKDSTIAYAVDMEHIATLTIPTPIKCRLINGWNPERSGDICIILKPNYYYTKDGDSETGTQHGSWNPYDTHIPFILMGWHINKGRSNRHADVTDIAPTICDLIGIQMPSGCIGNSIKE